MARRGRSPPVAYDRDAVIDWLLIVLPGVIWGASFLFIAEGLTAVAAGRRDVHPHPRSASSRSAWCRARASRSCGATGSGVAALGLLWFAFPMSMFPHAEQWISSALTGMLNGTVPLFATAVAAVLQRRWPPLDGGVGIGAGLFGGVLMAWPGLGAGGNSALGIVLVIAACISYGFAVNLARPLQQRNGALPVVWRALLVALILTAPLGLPRALHGHWTPRAVLSLLALGALGTCVANVMTTIAAGRLGATSRLGVGVLHPGRGAAPRRRSSATSTSPLLSLIGGAHQPGGRVGRALGVDAGGRGRAGSRRLRPPRCRRSRHRCRPSRPCAWIRCRSTRTSTPSSTPCGGTARRWSSRRPAPARRRGCRRRWPPTGRCSCCSRGASRRGRSRARIAEEQRLDARPGGRLARALRAAVLRGDARAARDRRHPHRAAAATIRCSPASARSCSTSSTSDPSTPISASRWRGRRGARATICASS